MCAKADIAPELAGAFLRAAGVVWIASYLCRNTPPQTLADALGRM